MSGGYVVDGVSGSDETDVSVQGLGAVLSQRKGDGKLHPAAYASRSLNQTERNYSLTELETGGRLGNHSLSFIPLW